MDMERRRPGMRKLPGPQGVQCGSGIAAPGAYPGQCLVDPVSAGQLPAEQSQWRSEEHTSELQSRPHLVCRLLLEKKKIFIYVNGQFFFPAVAPYPDTAFLTTPDPNLFGPAADIKDHFTIDLINHDAYTTIQPLLR